MPKVSVVIPAYNALPYLPETIETVLAQTFTDFELLVIDDGSTDRTAEWVTQLTDPRVRLIRQQNQGVSAARNTGITHATGEYIAFLDADDLWKPTKLEKQVQCLDENPEIGLVYTWTAMADQNGKPTGRVFSPDAVGKVWQTLIEFNVVGCGSTPLIRAGCFETVGLFVLEVSPSEDWDMWLRISAKYSFGVVKEALVLYRQHASSASKNFQIMLDTSRMVIERTFATAPTELLHLRNRSYGSIYLYLGWRAIENMDYQQAREFQKQSHFHHPQFFFTPRSLRLGVAIILLRYLGPDGYRKASTLLYTIRRSLLTRNLLTTES